MVIRLIRQTATTAKLVALVLWHAVRYPYVTSVVDVQATTVKLTHDRL